MLLPSTGQRVPAHTADRVNREIRAATERRVQYYATHRDRIAHRLRELDEEWDIERTLEANAASLVTVGSILALTVDRRWALLPAAVGAFLLQHALQGWCPPVPVFRRLGFRTADEIAVERYALKHLRGDFSAASQDPDAAVQAAAAGSGPR